MLNFRFTAIVLISISIISILDAAEPVKVFILAGQSNMEGKAKVSLMEYQVSHSDTRPLFEHLRKDGQWIERDDVTIKFLNRYGPLTVGYGSRDRIGPELQFGWTMGDHYQEHVVLIKTAWGGKSLARDFRPPSSGMPAEEELQQQLMQAKKKKPETTMEDIKKSYGLYYRAMLSDIRDTLVNIDVLVPGYQGQGYELAGFVWFQGWNDMVNKQYTAEYDKNMANFIRDVRKDLKSPALPFVIGQLGVGGEPRPDSKPNPGRDFFKKQQAKPTSLPEFKNNVALVKTDQYWDWEADAVFSKGWRNHVEEWEKVGSDYPFHYLGSAKFHIRAGKGFAEAILKLND